MIAFITVASVASLAVSIITLLRTRRQRAGYQLPTLNHQLVIVRDRAPFSDARLAEIMESWDPADERWLAVVQLVETYILDAQAQAAVPTENDNSHKIAHAHGAWLALAGLQEALLTLRKSVHMKPPRGGGGLARTQ